MADSRADPWDLAGGYRGADSGPADENAPLRAAVADRRTDVLRDVGIVDPHRVGVDAEVERVVASGRDGAEDGLAQMAAAVVEARSDLHQATRPTASTTACGVRPSSS